MKLQKTLLITAALLGASTFATADQVIQDDLIVNGGALESNGSTCIGADCVDGEDFGFDTLKLKNASPQIYFNDTSNSAAFPNTDWRVGVTDGAASLPAAFFIMNATSGMYTLQISPDGDVALGAGAEPVADAISMGAPGSERRITHVADGIDDSDAVTVGQFNTYAATVDTTDIDAEIQTLQSRIDDLSARLSALAEAE